MIFVLNYYEKKCIPVGEVRSSINSQMLTAYTEITSWPESSPVDEFQISVLRSTVWYICFLRMLFLSVCVGIYSHSFFSNVLATQFQLSVGHNSRFYMCWWNAKVMRQNVDFFIPTAFFATSLETTSVVSNVLALLIVLGVSKSI